MAIMENHNLESLNVLLKRDWFVEDEDAKWAIHHAQDDAFAHAYDNWHEYPERARWALRPDTMLKTPDVQMRVGELSESDLEKMKKANTKTLNDIKEKAWDEYSRHLERPVDGLDSQADEIWEQICLAKRKKSPTTVKKLENEYIQAKIKVEEANDLWLADKKDDFERKYFSM